MSAPIRSVPDSGHEGLRETSPALVAAPGGIRRRGRRGQGARGPGGARRLCPGSLLPGSQVLCTERPSPLGQGSSEADFKTTLEGTPASLE